MSRIAQILTAAVMAMACGTGASAASGDFNLYGNGKRIEASSEHSTRTLTIGEKYGAINATRGVTVNMTAGSGDVKVTISGPTNVVELTEVKVADGVLKVAFSENFTLKGENVVVDIKGVLPSGYKTSAGAMLNVNSDVNVKGDLKVNCSAGGAVNFNCEIKADELEASCSAGGEVRLNGQTTVGTGSMKVSAGGEMNISNIQVRELAVKASAGGEIEVAGKAETVSAKASAGGEINLKKLKVDRYSEVKASVGGEISK